MDTTLIKVRKETAERLKNLKQYKRQTYDEIINSVIDMKSDILSREDLENIEAGLRDLKAGRVYSSEEVAKRLGIKG